jgi:transcriptional regulator with XRE-family HTH domain
MRIDSYTTDDAVLSELGARLASVRLQRNLTQQELADEAGIARTAVQHLEAGESVRLTSFIRVLRVLGLLEALDGVVRQAGPSPIELLDLRGERRRRASGRRRKRTHRTDKAMGWRWGDEMPGSGA